MMKIALLSRSRRCTAIFALLAAGISGSAHSDEAAAPASAAAENAHVVMHKNPGCGCCEIWADHLRDFGFEVTSIADPNIIEFKIAHGLIRPLVSCHTAVVDGYFIEGHVPANDILRLLKDKPENVKGIAVPGMPLGSPGMEHPRPQDFDTIALTEDGKTYVFASHKAGDDFSRQAE